MRFIALLLLFVVSPLFAATYDDEWPIYVYGNTEIYYKVFTYIAMLAKDPLVKSFETVAVLISLLFAGKKLYEGELLGAIKHGAWSIGMSAFLLLPNTTVHIIDKRIDKNVITYTPAYDKVEGIPFYLAVVTSWASALSYTLTEIVDSAMAPVDGELSYSAVGIGKPYQSLMRLVEVGMSVDGNSTTATAVRAFSTYVRECGLKGAVFKDPDKYVELVNPNKDILKALDPNNLGLTNETMEWDGNSVKCSDFYNNQLVNYATVISDALYGKLKNSLGEINSTGADNYLSALEKFYARGASVIADTKQALLNLQMAKVIPDELEKLGYGISGLNVANNMTIQKSKNNMIVEGLGSFNWVVKILPMAIQFLFALMIALYLPMAIVAILLGVERGLKIVLGYGFGMVAFMFSNVSLAVVQNLVNYYGGMKIADLFVAYGLNPLTSTNVPYFLDYAASMAGLAGLLGAIAIPFTIGVVFKGETMAAVSMLSAIKGAYAGNTLEGALQDSTRARANMAAERNENDMYAEMISKEQIKWLNERGFFPETSAEAARMYAQLQSEIKQLAGGFAASRQLSGDGLDSFYQGSEMQSAKQIAQTQGYGQEMRVGRSQVEALEVAESAGGLAGAVAARTDSATVKAVGIEGRENYLDGVANNVASNIGATAKIGEVASFEEALRDGELTGIQRGSNMKYRASRLNDSDMVALGEHQGLIEKAGANKLKAGGVAGEDGHLTHAGGEGKADKYLDGLTKLGAKDINSIATFGDNASLKNALDAGAVKGLQMAGDAKAATEYFNSHKDLTTGDVDAIIKDLNSQIAHTHNAARKKELQAEKAKWEALKSSSAMSDGVLDASEALIKGGTNIGIERLESAAAAGIGSSDAFKARGAVKGLQSAMDANGYLNSQVTDDAGNLQFSRGGAANTEITGFMDGSERQARSKINQTIGVGKATMQNSHGGEISERQYMANLQKGSAFGFIAEGIKGEEAGERGLGISHRDGYIDNMKMRSNIARGLGRQEDEKYAAMEGKALAQDGSGNRVGDSEYYKNARATSIQRETRNQTMGEELRGRYGDELGGYGAIAGQHAKKAVDTEIGEAQGIAENLAKNPNIYAQNALYSELSRQQTTDAKIKAQGGITGAVATDVAESALKAAMQLGATQGNLQEFLKQSGMDEKSAKALAEAIVNGSQQGGEQLKRALAEAMESTRAASAGRTAAQLEQIETFGGESRYVAAQRFDAGVDAAKLSNKMALFESEEANKKLLEGIIGASRMFTEDEKKKQLIEAGLARIDENGELVPAVSGKEFAKALTKFQVGKEKLNVGQERFEISRDPEGNALVDASTQETRKRGTDTQVAFKGMGGEEIGTVLEAAAAGIAVDRGVKYLTGKGVFERAKEKLKPKFDSMLESMGFERLDKGSNGTGQHNQPHTHNNVENDASNHGNTPSSRSTSNITHTAGDVKAPSGYERMPSGILVPEGTLKNTHVPKTKGGMVASFLKSAAAFLGFEALANASDTIGKAINAFDPTQLIFGQPLGVGSDIPGNGMFRPNVDPKLQSAIASHFQQNTGLSLSAASAVTSPVDVNHSIQSQIQAFHQQDAMKRSLENLEQFKKFTHPEAPVPGITLQTSGGEIGFTRSPDGYLVVGGKETAIPYQDFKQQLSGNDGYAAAQIAQAISQSQISQNNIEQMLPNIGNMRTTEELLMTIRQSSVQQMMDARVGTFELIERAEESNEKMEEMVEALEKMKEKLGAD